MEFVSGNIEYDIQPVGDPNAGEFDEIFPQLLSKTWHFLKPSALLIDNMDSDGGLDLCAVYALSITHFILLLK